MKFYRSQDGKIHAFESDGSQDHLIPDNATLIDKNQIEAINDARQKAAIDSLSYAQKRALEYPDFHDYLDGIVKDDQTQIQAYIAACQAVKAKHPKQ